MRSLILTAVASLALLVAADGSNYYVYGAGALKGQPLFYADGLAYVGTVGPADASVVTNITLVTADTDDGSFTATPVNASTSVSGNWTSPKLYINANSGAFDSVGFTSNANTTITTTGFKQWGALLVWISDSGTLETKWFAEPVDVANTTYALKWNSDNVNADTAVPVVIKTTAPTLKGKHR